MPHDYLWPLERKATPDKMNTSFGPRIDENRWDFHDGIDLPADEGTAVHAMRGGKVHHAGPGGTGGYSSRHVVVKVQDPFDGVMYNVYLHLQTIAPAVATGEVVTQGQLIGTVGDDDATYPHLHFEFRKGSRKEIASVHPLSYLPYHDTANFTPPNDVRFNRLDGYMAARLVFGAGSKLEGDLKRVEVDLRHGLRILTTRVVDFDDKQTINDAKGDDRLFVDDIGVEGYQKSNMVAHRRKDLTYGIVVRKIPRRCDALVARVFDVGGNKVTSKPITVPDLAATDEFLDFEDGKLPPSGWNKVVSSSGTGTELAIKASAAHSGKRGLRCVDASTSESDGQRAGLTYSLPPGRFEWRAQAWFNPVDLGLGPGHSVHLLHFLSDNGLSVAARVRNDQGAWRAGLIAKKPNGKYVSEDGPVIEEGSWRRWRLELLRLATRETTAILYLGDGGQMREQARLDWDSSAREPNTFRAGVGFTSAGATATVLLDELWLTESGMSH